MSLDHRQFPIPHRYRALMWVLLGLCLVQGHEASAPSTFEFDVGQDFSLDFGEFVESQHSALSEDPDLRLSRLQELFRVYDTNGDNRMSSAEYKAWSNRDSGCENDGTCEDEKLSTRQNSKTKRENNLPRKDGTKKTKEKISNRKPNNLDPPPCDSSPFELHKNKKHLPQLRRDFQEQGWVLDDHFLSERDAGRVYGALHQRAESLWIHASHSGARKSDGSIDVSFIDRCIDGSVGCAGINKKIRTMKKEAVEAFGDNKYSFSYDRSLDYSKSKCDCNSDAGLCDFAHFVKSPLFTRYVENATGFAHLKLQASWFTRYQAGDFLFPHTDEPNGRVSMVIHMAKDWLPWHGGSLVVLDVTKDPWPYTTAVKQHFAPGFNTIHLLRVDKNMGPHYVQSVSQGVKSPRYAMVCWFL